MEINDNKQLILLFSYYFLFRCRILVDFRYRAVQVYGFFHTFVAVAQNDMTDGLLGTTLLI